VFRVIYQQNKPGCRESDCVALV